MDHYFAYGSNLHPRRLRERLTVVRLVGTGFLPGRRLAFHKTGADGSAKCDVAACPGRGCGLYGALYSVDRAGWLALDVCEGRDAGYERSCVDVLVGDDVITAQTYVAQEDAIDPALRPYDWYVALVAAGAAYHRFPEEYLAMIAETPSIVDPDEDRAATMWSLVERCA